MTSNANVDTNPNEPCVLCYENLPNAIILPCSHTFCDHCLSRLPKRRCPTCRGRCRRVLIDGVEMSIKGLATARHTRELVQLDTTLQVVFVGGRTVRVKRVVEKMCGGVDWNESSLYGRNAKIGQVDVRVAMVCRQRGARRMMADDVKCRRPDVLVLCWEVGKRGALAEMLEWDRLLRLESVPRIWMMITKGEKIMGDDEAAPGMDIAEDVDVMGRLCLHSVIAGIKPAELRPKACVVVNTDNEFSIGLAFLKKGVVDLAKKSRREAVETAIAEVKNESLRRHPSGQASSSTRETELVEAGRSRITRMRQRETVASMRSIIDWLSE